MIPIRKLKKYGFILIIITITILSFIGVLNQDNIDIYGLILAIFTPFITNYFFKKTYNKKIYIFINVYILINISLIFLTTFQANSLGYTNGIFKGNVDGVLYYDAAEYYDNILYLSDFNIIDFIKKFFLNIESGNKLYNIFIIYNMIVCRIFGNKIITLLLIKFNFTIAAIYTIDKIGNKINFKNTLIPVILFSFYPGVLQSNISLLRDNIILFLLVNIIYNYLNIKHKENISMSKLKLLISSFFLCIFRLYALVACIISIIVIEKSRTPIDKFKKYGTIAGFIMIIAIVSSILGYGFFGLKYIQTYMNEMSLTQGIFQTIIRIIVGYRIVLESMSNYIIPNILLMVSPIYIFIVNFILIFNVFFKFKIYKKTLQYITFYFIFAFLNAILMVLRDGIIVERIYIMWLWVACLIITNTKKLHYSEV